MTPHNGRGPDPRTLGILGGMLPSFVEHREDKRILRGQRPAKDSVPIKICNICTKVIEYGLVEPVNGPELWHCVECVTQLENGWSAVINQQDTRKLCFVKFVDVPDMMGKVLHVTDTEYKRLLDRFPPPPPANDPPSHTNGG